MMKKKRKSEILYGLNISPCPGPERRFSLGKQSKDLSDSECNYCRGQQIETGVKKRNADIYLVCDIEGGRYNL